MIGWCKEKVFSFNFTEVEKKFVLSLHYNGDNSYLFVNGKQELKFKAKDDQIIDEKLCLGNLSTDWTNDEVEYTGLFGQVYDFVVDYEAIDGVRPIYDMHRYLMENMILYKTLLINLIVTFFGMLGTNALECVSVINKNCISRPKIIETNPDEPVFFPYSIKINKCSGSCNGPKDPFARLCVPDIVKNINVKVYNLMTRINETKNIVLHETCKFICRLSK